VTFKISAHDKRKLNITTKAAEGASFFWKQESTTEITYINGRKHERTVQVPVFTLEPPMLGVGKTFNSKLREEDRTLSADDALVRCCEYWDCAKRHDDETEEGSNVVWVPVPMGDEIDRESRFQAAQLLYEARTELNIGHFVAAQNLCKQAKALRESVKPTAKGADAIKFDMAADSLMTMSFTQLLKYLNTTSDPFEAGLRDALQAVVDGERKKVDAAKAELPIEVYAVPCISEGSLVEAGTQIMLHHSVPDQVSTSRSIYAHFLVDKWQKFEG